jgi:hypothetical protein
MIERLTEIRGDKSPAQIMEALTGWYAESISMDFHELRQDFNPPDPFDQIHRRGRNND